MKTVFKVDPLTVVFALVIAALTTGGFFAGRASKTTNEIDNSTNVIVNNNYSASVSSSASASVAMAQPTSNVTIDLEFDVTNFTFGWTNSMSNGVDPCQH